MLELAILNPPDENSLRRRKKPMAKARVKKRVRITIPRRNELENELLNPWVRAYEYWRGPLPKKLIKVPRYWRRKPGEAKKEEAKKEEAKKVVRRQRVKVVANELLENPWVGPYTYTRLGKLVTVKRHWRSPRRKRTLANILENPAMALSVSKGGLLEGLDLGSLSQDAIRVVGGGSSVLLTSLVADKIFKSPKLATGIPGLALNIATGKVLQIAGSALLGKRVGDNLFEGAKFAALFKFFIGLMPSAIKSSVSLGEYVLTPAQEEEVIKEVLKRVVNAYEKTGKPLPAEVKEAILTGKAKLGDYLTMPAEIPSGVVTGETQVPLATSTSITPVPEEKIGDYLMEDARFPEYLA